MSIKINVRVLGSPLSGVQRYLNAILDVSGQHYNHECLIKCALHGLQGHLWEQCILPATIKKQDILWSPSNTGPLFHKCRHVVTMHDFATLDHPEWTSRQFNTFYRFLLPKIVKRCDGIIAISEYTKSRILYHSDIQPEKVFVIKNGVDASFYTSFSECPDFSSLRNKYGIPTGRYVLSVSSIEPRKNISRLLKAWKSLSAQIDDDIHLVLVGRPNPRIFADSGLNEIPPRVIFTGFVDDVDLPYLYQNAYLFAYLSLYEGFGLPPLEAMAAGVAVLTSNTTSIPEVVADKAITVDPLSVADIADGLLLLLKNESLRHQLAMNGPIHAQSFNWIHTAKQTFDYIKNFE